MSNKMKVGYFVFMMISLSGRYGVAQVVVPSDAERRQQAHPTAEDAAFLECVQTNKCSAQDEACMQSCGIQAMKLRDAGDKVLDVVSGGAAQNKENPAIKERFFGYSSAVSAGPGVPQIVYLSDKGRMFQTWARAQLDVAYAEGGVRAAQEALREERHRQDEQGAKAEACKTMTQTKETLGAGNAPGDADACVVNDASDSWHAPVSMDALKRAEIDAMNQAMAAKTNLMGVEATMQKQFSDLYQAIQEHPGASAQDVLKEKTDYYVETFCNGRCQP